MFVGELLTRAAKLYPNKTASIFKDIRLTYCQLNERTNSLANALKSIGVKPQDRVAVICHNSHNFLEVFFAIVKIGAVSTNLNWRLSPKELTFLIKDSEARIVFLSKHFEYLFEPLRQNLGNKVQFVTIDYSMPETLDYGVLVSDYSKKEPEVNVGYDDTVLQIYTSGTTGRPKGVMLSHKNIISNAVNTIIEMQWLRSTKFLSVLPIFHIGLYSPLNCIFMGGTNIFLDKFDSEAVLSTINKEGVSRMGLAPVMFKFLLDYPDFDKFDLSSLEVITYAGAPMPLPLLRRAMKKFGCAFYGSFGMTEMSPIMTILPPEDHLLYGTDHDKKKLRSVGRPILNVEVKVVDENGSDCSPGVVGEIIGSGETVMKGYHNMPDATVECIRDGWYYTGDMGYMDEYGYLYIVDRKKDMIISGGENIYPKEVEDIIIQLDGVAEVAVIGVPDDTWGEAVKAIIVRKAGATLTEGDIIEHCKKNIASYKKPKSVNFVEILPKNPTGKILKHKLREPYWKNRGHKI